MLSPHAKTPSKKVVLRSGTAFPHPGAAQIAVQQELRILRPHISFVKGSFCSNSDFYVFSLRENCSIERKCFSVVPPAWSFRCTEKQLQTFTKKQPPKRKVECNICPLYGQVHKKAIPAKKIQILILTRSERLPCLP